MLNIEKYKDEIIERLHSDDLDYVLLQIYYIYHQGDGALTAIDCFKWLCSEYKEPRRN